jgi:chaperonin GroES
MLIDAVKSITSVSDILSGNQDTQTAPTTALALIEQGQKVFTAIYQRIHRALGQEAMAVFRLNRDYIDEEKYFAFGDDAQSVGRADFEDKDLDIIPVSDPRAINDKVKLAKAQILQMFNGDPLVNQIEIRKRSFEAAGIEDIDALLEVPVPPPPPPDPKAITDLMRAEAEVRAKDATTAKTLLEAAQLAYAIGAAIGDPNIQADAQRMLDEAIGLADKVSQKGQGNEPTDGTGPVSGMEGEPVDGGIPELPTGLPGPTGDAMGEGPPLDAAGPVPG